MRKFLVGVAVLCLLAPAFALVAAMPGVAAPAVVVSINHEAKSVSFHFTVGGQASDETATWNDKTKWFDETQGKPKPATVDLAKSLEKGSKIYAESEDGILVSVTALAPDAEIWLAPLNPGGSTFAAGPRARLRGGSRGTRRTSGADRGD